MRIHHVRHSEPKFPYNREEWLKKNGHQFTRTLFFSGEAAPNPEEIDVLVVFGGSMGAYEEAKYPWLTDETRWIERVVSAGVPTIGLCLGGQLLSRIAGARVYPNPAGPEIGFFPMTLTDEGTSSPWFREFPRTFEAFEWHDDVFDLPSGAVKVTTGEFWGNQAWTMGDTVLATQFHLEFTREHMAKGIEEEGYAFPTPRTSVQSGTDIASNAAGFERIGCLFETMLGNAMRMAGGRPSR